MAEGEGEETTQRTTTTKRTTTATGIARVWDAVAVTPMPRELVLLGRVQVNGIVKTRSNQPVRRNNKVIEILWGSGWRTPPDDNDDDDNAASWTGQGGFGPDI